MPDNDSNHNPTPTEKNPENTGLPMDNPSKLAANSKPDEEGTWRMPDSPITSRLEENPVTTRIDSQASVLGSRDAITLKENDLVENRYRVTEGPLGGNAGEAEIFKCRDELSDEIIILKLYRFYIYPHKEVLDKLAEIQHPHLIGLKHYGYWNSRFYEIMEYCEGGSLADFMPLDESELRRLVPPIASGLHYCHDLKIIHRDVKPSNLFYRKSGEAEVVIGDFGISSLLEKEEKVRRTQTFKNLTMDYAAPELLSREEVSPKTDFYALGITFIHLLTGVSPFAGNVNPTSILAAHLTGNIPLPETRSESVRILLRGLLQLRPENRWGYQQLMQWYREEPILTDQGFPWKDEIFSGADVPFPGYPEAKNPKELAKYLGRFDAATELFRGNVFRWVYDHFDPQMADAIKLLEENYSDRPSLAVFKLRFLLDPSQAFRAGHYWVTSLDDILKMLLTRDPKLYQVLADGLYGEFLESWIEGTQPAVVSRELVANIRKIRREFPDKERGLAALMYLLDPSQPLYVDEETQIHEPEDLGKYLRDRPDLEPLLRDMVFIGRFQSWLRIVYPQREEEADFIDKCLDEMSSVPDQAWNAITWHFWPEAPFLFRGHSYKDTASLAEAMDKSVPDREAAMETLKNNTLRNWLLMTGRLSDPSLFDQVMADPVNLPEAKLEAILHLLDPKLPWPRPVAGVNQVNLGKVKNNADKEARFLLKNEARGYLSGIITLKQKEGSGFSIEPMEIEGGPVEVRIIVKPLGKAMGEKLSAEILVETNGGNLKIPVSCQVSAPLEEIFSPSLAAGLILGCTLGFSRFVISYSNTVFETRITRFMEFAMIRQIRGVGGFLFIMDILLVVLGGLILYVYRMLRNRD